ncbi:MAG: TrkA family potassium uptake protein [Lentisphaerae bacterium]|nr:TrkA family potassium uptake protein [Lentisphaerota bacterium]
MRRIGIIGGGRFGANLAQALAERGVEILLLDRDRGVVDRMAGIVAKAMEGDATEEGTLEAAGFRDCDMAVVAVSTDMESSILTTLALKEMKIAYVIAKAAGDMHGKVLSRVGADRVVYPDKDMAARLARTLVAPSVLDYVEVAEGISVLEIQAPLQFVSKTVSESKIRKTYGVTILVLRRAPQPGGAQETIVSPNADDVIELGDTMVIFGTDEKLRRLEKELREESVCT